MADCGENREVQIMPPMPLKQIHPYWAPLSQRILRGGLVSRIRGVLSWAGMRESG